MHELGAGVNNNWIVAPVINQNIEENVTFQFDHFNAVLLSCSIFARYTGRYPESLQEIYDAGYMFFMPYNFILGQPMNLNGPSVDGGLPGEIWIEHEDGQVWLRYSYGVEDFKKNRGVKQGYFLPWDGAGSLKFDAETLEYYSDEANRKLLAMQEMLGFVISMYDIHDVEELLARPSWPFTPDGRNPLTGEPLKMGANPGEYFIELKQFRIIDSIVYRVYGRDGKPIPGGRHAKVEQH